MTAINRALRATNPDKIVNNILDGFIVSAQEKLDASAGKILSSYVALLRAISMVHKQNHWLSINYGDHLLFDRIHGETTDNVDQAAEKTMGLCGDLSFGIESQIAKKFEPKDKSMVALLESSLKAEQAFQKMAQTMYDKLKEADQMTLGLDDMIMAHASDSETRIYLLQQALLGANRGS